MFSKPFISFCAALLFMPSALSAQGIFPGGDIMEIPESRGTQNTQGTLLVETPLLGTDVGLSDIVVYAQTGETKKELNKTQFYYNNQNEHIGTYSKQELEPGDWQVWVDSPGYKKTQSRTITVTRGEQSKLSIPIDIAPDNVVTGTITDESGVPLPGALVTVASDGNKSLAVTNEDGEYEVTDYFSANKEYAVTARSGSSVSQIGSVTFLQPAGQSVTKNGKVAKPNPNAIAKVYIEAFASRYGYTLKPEKRLAVDFTLRNTGTSNPTLPRFRTVTQRESELNLKPGCYEIKTTSEDYIPKRVRFCTHDTDYIALDMWGDYGEGECKQAPAKIRKLFSNYWLCGKEATQMANDKLLSAKLERIAQRAAFHRKYYLNDSPAQEKILFRNLPIKIEILSSDDHNASYAPISHSGCGIKFGDVPPYWSESIIFSTDFIKSASLGKLETAYFHELTHGIDHRYTKCKGFISSQTNRFNRTFHVLARKEKDSKKDYFASIRESTYSGIEDHGHPEDEPPEAYASANVIKEWYMDPFEKKIKGLPPDVRQLLDVLVYDAGFKPKP